MLAFVPSGDYHRLGSGGELAVFSWVAGIQLLAFRAFVDLSRLGIGDALAVFTWLGGIQ